ncbi:uncharacterized protein LOC131321077 [Rhododendron vialii]|uniref:uncharacterized protein LOC131321077 n=1 Tax=Rhododendron vialii TaxID=182163 RepID=UPI00265EAFD2|nr:uncharacterized protein LOC131321077 [Rhododendron vialii]
MAKSSAKARDFFGYVQKVYTLFSGSPQRWDILRAYVKGLTPKALSVTRWESNVESVRAIRNQAPELRDALIEIVNVSKEDIVFSEAKGLCKNALEDFEFLISLCIWHKILDKVNQVSKILQQEKMDFEDAITRIKELILFFEELREDSFENLMKEAKELAHNVDQALALLKNRFKQFELYDSIFGFLFNAKFKSVSEEQLMEHCTKLESFLEYKQRGDIYGKELFQELRHLKTILPREVTKSIDILDFIKSYWKDGGFQIVWVAYRILLTIPVTVALAERSFSKLKLIKTYLRTTMSMSQERLSGLAMISIENEYFDKIHF